MLTDDVERYLTLRRALGYKLQSEAARLRSFARFAADRGNPRVLATTAFAWAEAAPTPDARQRRIQDVARFGRFLRAEDPAHEEISPSIFVYRRRRPTPYIYTREELERLLDAAARLRPNRRNPLRRAMQGMLIGLLAATGLRLSEALNLTLDDLLPGGVLRIRHTKFSKSRLVPLHPTVVAALDRYLKLTRSAAGTSDYVFHAGSGASIHPSTMQYTFRRIVRLAGLAPDRARRPRIHDLRHSFATHVLEQSATDRAALGRNFVALATYLGHVHPASTYWYLQATPELMRDISTAAEVLFTGEVA